ncbi:uncharacterized protein ACRADG_003673 isoform 2-T3 [Cochliomyia hominivorax]
MEYNPLDCGNVIWTTEQEVAQDDTNAMLTLILEEVRSLKNEVQQLRTEIHELKTLRGEPELRLLPTNMPFDNLEEFKEFDEKLAVDDDLRAELKYALEKCGNRDYVTFLRAALRFGLKDELAVHFTWRGTTEKPSIQNFNFLTLIKDICLANFDNASLADVNRICHQHFLHANDRLKKRKATLEANSASTSPVPVSTPSSPPPAKQAKIQPNKSQNSVKIKASPSPTPPPALLPGLPFMQLPDLQEFDDKLLDDRNLKLALKQFINKINARDYASFVRASFRAIMSDKLAMELSWRGTKEKPSIQDFTIFVIIRVYFP